MMLQSSVIDQQITIQDCNNLFSSCYEKHWLLYDLYTSAEANGDTAVAILREHNLVHQTIKKVMYM